MKNVKKTIAVLPGDGIGSEVTNEAVKILKVIAQKFNHEFAFNYGLIGACAIDKYNTPLPEDTKQICLKADAILLGAVGHPKFDNNPNSKIRPEQGLLSLRKELGLFANIRPVKCYDALLNNVPLKSEIVKSVDFTVIRELTGGIYFGEKGRTNGGTKAFDKCDYSKLEITRITEIAYEEAMKRNRKVTVVDKANVLETSRLWRETVNEVSLNYPEVSTNYMYVDNAAMQLILNPKQFDVILTENMFGDILSDEASAIVGSLGLMPSASIGKHHALYEPIHGSYPQAAGKNIANPIGSILSAAMLLDMSFNLTTESYWISNAVNEVIESKYLTEDLSPLNSYGTSEVGDKISNFIQSKKSECV